MKLQGVIAPPGDKSISHRLAIFSLLGRGETWVTNLSPGADVASSFSAVRLLGGLFYPEDQFLNLHGAEGRLTEEAEIDCGNSGTTMRLLMGLLAGRPGRFTLWGDESLNRRPMNRVAEPLRRMGAVIQTTDGHGPVAVEGAALTGIEYNLPVASAQLKSAVLLAGLQAGGQTTVREPAPSRDHTERLIDLCKGRILKGEGVIQVQASDLILPPSFRVPGDASSAAFFVAAASITPDSRITADNVLLNPSRTGFLMVLNRMGARVSVEVQSVAPEPSGRISARYSPQLRGVEIVPAEIPFLIDEIPILALTATQARGTTIFRQVGELRFKESDRLAALVSQLGALGADIRDVGDDLVITGPTPLKSADHLDSRLDHRLAMTLRLALNLIDSEAKISGEESVAISYPGFHEDLGRLTT